MIPIVVLIFALVNCSIQFTVNRGNSSAYARYAQHHDPHFVDNRKVIVHLFEWKWKEVAKECEEFLGPYG